MSLTGLYLSVFNKDRENEFLLVWTTTPWTLSSNAVLGVNVNLDYIKLKAADDSIYYFAEENSEFHRLDKQFEDKNQWIKGVPKLKTISQIFKEKVVFTFIRKDKKGKELVGLKYIGPYDHIEAQNIPGGYPFCNDDLNKKYIFRFAARSN